MYELGCYKPSGELEHLRFANTREEAKEKYNLLHNDYKCTIWIKKIEFVDPKDL